MQYTALARKWRPQTFDECVGQQHVLQGLMHALDNNKLHHAYLFTGTRGVGKTTIARIVAKGLNCETGITSKPCGVCSACQEISAGRFPDLIEIDAASRTRVEDTREILDNVQYAPTRGRFKVYLIDEVHMLSTHSFNALLKTLEEPPEHVKFLLATTDPHKLPITVLSRCLQFHLRMLDEPLISERLQLISQQENVSAAPEALSLLARAAKGSMRDALSLMDQALAYGGGAVEYDPVRTMLGAADRGDIYQLLQHLIQHNSQAVFSLVETLAGQAVQFVDVLTELSRFMVQVGLKQQLPQHEPTEFDSTEIANCAAQLSPEQVQLYYEILVRGGKDIHLAPDVATGFTMIMLRLLAFQPSDAKPVATQPIQPAPKAAPSPKVTAPQPKQPTPEPVPAPTQPGLGTDASWLEICNVLPLAGMVKQFALNTELVNRTVGKWVLRMQQQHAGVINDRLIKQLEMALKQYFNQAIQLSVEEGQTQQTTPAEHKQQAREDKQKATEQAMLNDPHVQYMQQKMGAELDLSSVKPHDEPNG